MAKNKLLLTKKRSAAAKKLTEKRAEEKRLTTRAAALDAQLEGVEDEVPAELEQQVQEVADSLEAVATEIADLEQEIADLDTEIADIDDQLPGSSSNPSSNRSRDGPVNAPTAARFRCRSRCFENRTQRDAFYAQSPVKSFLQRIRSMAAVGTRSARGAELTIPTEVLDILRDNLNQYSKLITKVRLRSVSGHARQNVIGKIPEGIWMEMCGKLNELDISFGNVEMDGYKVGGYISICNAILEDSDIALATEIINALGAAIGLALDKAILYGTSTKMPLGIVTRLAQTAKPGDYAANARPWVKLSETNILAISGKTDAALFKALIEASGAAKGKHSRGQKFWAMNEKTHMKLVANALSINAAGAVVTGVNGTMPIIGGAIEELSFIPDDVIIGGYGDMYPLAERAGTTIGRSEHVRFIEDQTVFKGTARYDGKPAIAEAFVAIGLDGNLPAADAVTFAQDKAN